LIIRNMPVSALNAGLLISAEPKTGLPPSVPALIRNDAIPAEPSTSSVGAVTVPPERVTAGIRAAILSPTTNAARRDPLLSPPLSHLKQAPRRDERRAHDEGSNCADFHDEREEGFTRAGHGLCVNGREKERGGGRRAGV
jgi:hypothetical protein